MGANNFGKKILLALLAAVVAWGIVYKLGLWPKYHPLLSITISIVAAVVVMLVLHSSKKLIDGTVVPLVLMATGSALVLVAISVVVPPCRQVRITCVNSPIANPYEVGAFTGDAICWLPSTVGYTVEFKSSNLGDPGNGGRRSPVRKPQGGEEITITVQTSVSQTRTVDVQRGLFWYSITCDNGYHVDPKVRVPPAGMGSIIGSIFGSN